jgi:hypothetical protein
MTAVLRNTFSKVQRTEVEKKEELDTALAAATAPVPVFEIEGSGQVIDEFRAGLAASSTVATHTNKHTHTPHMLRADNCVA